MDDAQNNYNIEGFENGKGEKLDIKKNEQKITPSNDFYPNDYQDNSSSSSLKALGILLLIGSLGFTPPGIIFNKLFFIGTAVCFAMFAFCLFYSTAIDRSKGFKYTSQKKENNNNLSSLSEDEKISNTIDNENDKNLTSQVQYDKNTYYAAKENNNLPKI